MSTGRTYDIKVGYTCNNNCFHCVVKPNSYRAGDKYDLSYSEILECINSKEGREADIFVITGGEPTLRREFMRIIRYISDNYPGKQICLQTNARKLKPFIREIHDAAINMHYVVALHGIGELHNRITQIEDEDTFSQTWESIEEIKKVYGDFNEVARIEIVLSKLNYLEIGNIVEYLYQKDVKHIGISYPHLDGYYIDDPEKARIKGFSYKELKPELYKLHELCMKYNDLELIFEKVPRCMWRDADEKLLELPPNVHSLDRSLEEQVTVKYPGRETDTSFIQTYPAMHKHSGVCKDCILCCRCLGVWFEAVDLYGDEGFVPICEHERSLV